jgi:hypothetical protein
MRRDGGEDFVRYWNNDDMLEKLREFKLIQSLRKNYDPKNFKYYLPHIFKVDYDSRPDYIVAILRYPVDCFDFVEYATFDQMLYYVDTYGYDIISNPHVKVDGNRITKIDNLLERHSNTYKSNKKKDLYPKQNINSENIPVPLDQYRLKFKEILL